MWVNIDEESLRLVAGRMAEDRPQVSADILSAIERYEDPANDAFIQVARDEYSTDEIEIDDQDVMTAPSDEGRWVSAWVYVSNDDAGACEECGSVPGTPEYGTVGDGFDGLCPSCADKEDEDD